MKNIKGIIFIVILVGIIIFSVREIVPILKVPKKSAPEKIISILKTKLSEIP